MGNRAIIVPKEAVKEKTVCVGIYVHWYDDGLLARAMAEVEDRGYRSVAKDEAYGMARLCQTLCERCPDGLNIGLVTCDFGNPEWVRGEAMWLDEGFVMVGDHGEAEVLDTEDWAEEVSE